MRDGQILSRMRSWAFAERSHRRLIAFGLGAISIAGFAAIQAVAQDPPKPTLEELQKSFDAKMMDLDTVWTMIAGFLVMWMQAGFASVEAGFTRPKNAVNIMMKNLLDFCFGAITFWLIGFGLMFSMGNDYVGQSGFMLKEEQVKVTVDGKEEEKSNFDSISWAKVPLDCKYFFQMVFCATAATIVSGAMAERTNFTAYMIFSLVMTAFIYPVSGHWIWGGGWLANKGFFDFAGSTVVHSLGGWVALIGALIVGPRTGKYVDGKVHAFPGHNIPLATIGVFILWLGWFGFNPGSTMAAVGGDIAKIAVNTNLAGCVGGLAALFLSKVMFGKWDASMALNGVLAGLVSITCPCMWVDAPGSLAIGAIGGVLVVLSVVFIDSVLKIDDPVGASSVHGVCGAWGTLALGLFSKANGEAAPKLGLLYGGTTEQLIAQAIGVGAIFAWGIVTGAVLFGILSVTVGLRVKPQEELEGLDTGEHGNEAYHGFVLTS